VNRRSPALPRTDVERNRRRLIVAARHAFAADPGASLNAVAKQAQVGVGTLYRHFPSRAALLAEVYRHELTRLCRRGQETVQAAVGSAVQGAAEQAAAGASVGSVVQGVAEQAAVGSVVQAAAEQAAVGSVVQGVAEPAAAEQAAVGSVVQGVAEPAAAEQAAVGSVVQGVAEPAAAEQAAVGSVVQRAAEQAAVEQAAGKAVQAAAGADGLVSWLNAFGLLAARHKGLAGEILAAADASATSTRPVTGPADTGLWAVRQELLDITDRLLRRARDSGTARPGSTALDLLTLTAAVAETSPRLLTIIHDGWRA
jgi:AcrR family transcriptional regulator